MQNYVVYHAHSDISNVTAGNKADSVTKYEDYIKLAKEYGMKALGISEHGSVLNWMRKKEKIEKAGMKYIHASEVYLTKEIDLEKGLERDNYHFVLIAKNYEGVKELNTLLSTANNKDNGQNYFNPRITFEQLKSTSDNIIATTACLGSPIWQLYKKAHKENDEVSESYLNDLLLWIKDNKHRVFLEIQYHNHPEQIEYNRLLLRLSHETGAPLIAGTDTHALNQEHAEARKVLLKAKNATYGDEDSFDLTFKSYDELVDMFAKQGALLESTYLEAIENTNKLADMIEEFELDRSPKYPKLYKDEEALNVFKEKINEGVKKRKINKLPKPDRKLYYDRIEEELETYVKLDAVHYMLLMKDIIDWCHDRDIMQGYGRGSVNGSLIAYVLGITEMDSIKHNLNFFRFLNPDRVTLADIDVDFPPSRRHEVIEYISNIAGIDFSAIVTFNTLALAGSIREAGRGLNMPLHIVDEIAKSVEKYNNKEVVPEFYRKKYPELFKYVDIFNGIVISIGSHPSGFLVSPVDLNSNISTVYTKSSKYKVSAVDMGELEDNNYVKLDILNLDNIELVNETCKLANIERLTPDNININDEAVWNSMRESTLGVFQMEEQGDYINKLFSPETIENIESTIGEINRIDLLSMANGAIRPAGNSYRDDLANGNFKDNGHPALNEMLKDTLGFLIYQEQIMNFLTDFCEHTGSESDTVRRGLAKKGGTEQFLPTIKERFVNFMNKKYKEPKEHAEEILESFSKVIEDASGYGFSINHSQPYSYLGYIATWLRHYYPLEFITVALNIWEDDIEKTANVVRYAKSKGVNIESISFGKSRAKYVLNKEEKTIYKGIESIKYLNARIAEELYELSKNEYDSNDFVRLVADIIEQTTVQSNQMEILIRLNYFKYFGDKEVLLEIYQTMIDKKKANTVLYPEFADKVVQVKKRKRNKQTKKMEDVLENKIVKTPLKYDKKHIQKTKETRLDNLRKYEKAVRDNPPEKIDIYDQILFEKNNLGYIETFYPKTPNNVTIVMEMFLKYTPTIVLYQFSTGMEIIVKIDKRNFWGQSYDNGGEQLLYEGDVIKINKTYTKNAMKKVGNKWVKNGDKKHIYISDLSILKPSKKRLAPSS